MQPLQAEIAVSPSLGVSSALGLKTCQTLSAAAADFLSWIRDRRAWEHTMRGPSQRRHTSHAVRHASS